jgi:hypothetical protein
VVVVLDHSASMDSSASGDFAMPTPTKWDLVEAELPMALASHPALLYGLLPFGNSGTTCADFSKEPSVTPGPNQLTTLSSRITTVLQPDGFGTNTGEAIDAAVAMLEQYAAANPTRQKGRLLLVSDGSPNCSSLDNLGGIPTFTVGRLQAAETLGIKTYVVSVGVLAAQDDTNFGSMAVAGGAACVGPSCTKSYYPGPTATALRSALSTVLGKVDTGTCY